MTNAAIPLDVETYLAAVQSAAKEALIRLRGQIIAAAQEVTEGINYGVPAFKYRGRPLVSYGAGKAHCSFYVQSPNLLAALGSELAGYDTLKGTVRFKVDQTLPDSLVRAAVQGRMQEIDDAMGRPA